MDEGIILLLSCMEHIAYRLNQFLKNRFELSEDIVVISNLVNHDGSVCANINNRVVLFITNIEKETAMSHSSDSHRAAAFATVKPIFLNLYLMVSANFNGTNYNESLKFISSVIGFFQINPVFNHQNSPELNRKIDKIILDIENIQTQDLSNIWGMLGAKYVPSILYKVRMITIDDQIETFRVNRTSDVDVTLKSQSDEM
ncbi:DUF4255 domain-containing protein [Shewanella sp. A14]